jgi:hypothetical protein
LRIRITDADPDPTFHSDADPDPTFQFDPGSNPDPSFHYDPDPAFPICSGSGSSTLLETVVNRPFFEKL